MPFLNFQRQLIINNLETLTRNELLDIFKAHIMPKPQRQRNVQTSHSQDSSDSTTSSLAKEVKRIKLNREPYSQPVYTHNSSIERMDVRENLNKRSIEETINKPKRQKIQWP